MRRILFLLFILYSFQLFSGESQIKNIIDRGYINIGLTKYDNFPFYYFDKDGNLVGLDIDSANKLGEILKVEVRFNRDSTTINQLYNKLNKREIDLICGLKKSYIGAMTLLYTNSYYRIYDSVLINRLSPIEDFNKPVVVGVVESNFNKKNIFLEFKDSQITKFKDLESGVTELIKGKVNVIYSNRLDIDNFFEQKPEIGLYVKKRELSRSNEYFMAVNSEDRLLLQWLNLFIELELKESNDE